MINKRSSAPAACPIHCGFCDEWVCAASAQDIVEYALVAMLIGLGSVAALRGLATNIANAFTNVQATLASSA